MDTEGLADEAQSLQLTAADIVNAFERIRAARVYIEARDGQAAPPITTEELRAAMRRIKERD